MRTDKLMSIAVDELLKYPAGQKLAAAMETIAAIQRHVFALRNSEDDASVKLQRIGTVLQLSLISILAKGKKPSDLTSEDFLSIAQNVSDYAILPDGQRYSVFVFTLYADYIDFSAACLRKLIPKSSKEVMESSLASIEDVANTIRSNSGSMQEGTMTESAYVESCLWLSLEGMIKLLSASLVTMIGPEYTQLVQAVSQLAFEYGRYVLFAKEQALLDSYIQNQYLLDDQLQSKYEEFLIEVQENADRFQALIDAAFSPKLHEALLQSADLARAAGVKEEELLSSIEDVDSFFMN